MIEAYTTLRVVKVIVGEITTQTEGNIVTPIRRVRLILENGAIFDRSFLGFAFDHDWMVQNFKDEKDKWKLYEPNAV